MKKDLGALPLYLHGYDSVFVVYDRNAVQYAEKISGSKFNHVKGLFAVEATEERKTVDTVLAICRWLLGQGADRAALLLAVGGGITTDIAGFAAAIYKRGIPFASVPTTLLAQVDASIGGKNGVNVDNYKNMLGVMRQPVFTYICPQPLATLPDREYASGVAELLKTFIIKDAALYERAVAAVREREDLWDLIKAAARIKKKIVKRDPFEKGLRKVLNLGHTYGHAIEWLQHEKWTGLSYNHGEAVAIGIVKAARLSEERGIGEPGIADKIKRDFAICGLPTELPCEEEELREAIEKDKKSRGGRVDFVFIRSIGDVVVRKL